MRFRRHRQDFLAEEAQCGAPELSRCSDDLCTLVLLFVGGQRWYCSRRSLRVSWKRAFVPASEMPALCRLQDLPARALMR